MADLQWELAENLAAALTTIGHPMAKAAIMATALDLMRWCTGAIIAGRVYQPEEQAQWLVDTVRFGPAAWHDWRECGGTAALHALFLSQYPPAVKSPTAPLTPEEMYARGILKRPCARCDDSGYVGQRPQIGFCDCRHGRYQRDWEGERGLARINATLPPGKHTSRAFHQAEPITLAQMARALDEERTRKERQLHALGLD